MVQQDAAGIADTVENVAVRGQPDAVHGMVRRVVEFGNIECRQIHQIAQSQHDVVLVNVAFLVQPQFGGQHALEQGRHRRVHLQAHDGRELAVAELGFDHRQQVAGDFFVKFGVGIPCHPEHGRRLHGHAGEQKVQVGGHHVFEADIAV